MKPTLVLAGLACCLAACSAAPQATTTTGSTRTQAATPLPTRVVATKTTLAVDGALAAAIPSAAPTFESGGVVRTVNVGLGQMVKTGDVLATVANTELKDDLADAELALQKVEASIRLQNAPPTQEEVAAAKAALNAAYASYNVTKAGTTQSELERARASWESAWLSYIASQTSRDVHCGTPAGNQTVDCKMHEASYGNAFEGMLSARASYQALMEPVAQSGLTQAYASVSSAKAKLEALSAGPTEQQAKITQLQLDAAQATLELARSNLSDATLLSPCDCVVQEIKVAPGAAASGAAFTLVDVSRLQFKTANVSERNVGQIKIGAAVTIRVKAHSETFTGKVSAILAQSSGASSGTALYTVLIDVDPAQKTLLPGMTGQAEIEIAK